MKTTSNSRLNREQQVQVVIRLKPEDHQNRSQKCVYLSQNENELVVQAANKKEIFLFDSIAPQYSTQPDVYRMIGQQAVQASFEGYNCCIFAYGQTGAGKTYSVMGSIPDLADNYQAQSRGILPRIIQDIFSQIKNLQSKKCTITCSYMQIYNQQIFDLLSPDKKIHPIREDFKRGVFVEGLIQRKVYCYEEGINMLLQGQKTRRISSTAMNNQSSRSHAIFTINIQSQIEEDQAVKIRKSKLNIIDLAGSERVKHTNVEGQRLKEGCNINKSLHVLGNVINSLVESSKKKKHIPFRDSKLTHFLKDSLGGNSITKLLANVHCGKAFIGDTLSTLMFAKRAKCLKMKVEMNENHIENFDSLRKEVKKLRQQLAQAKYFKDETQRTQRPSFQSYFETNLQKPLQVQCQTPNYDALKLFQQNQSNYKALIQIYQEHSLNCDFYNANNKKKHLPMVNEWKIIQKKNLVLTKLLRRLPSFSKIYRQHLQLKEQLAKRQEERHNLDDNQKEIEQNESFVQLIRPASFQNKQHSQQIIEYYEELINEMKQNFELYITNVQKSYSLLQAQSKLKQKKLKDYIKRQGLELGIEQLKNQNEYLHLSILNLQNQISQFQQNEQKVKYEHDDLSIIHTENILPLVDQQQKDYIEQKEELYHYFLAQIQKIKKEAIRQNQLVSSQLQLMLKVIQGKDQEIKVLSVQLKRYKEKSKSKSISRRKNGQSQPRAKRNLYQRSLSIVNFNKSQFDLSTKQGQNNLELPRLSFSNSIFAFTEQKAKQSMNKSESNHKIQSISLQLASLKEQKIFKDHQINQLKGQIKKILEKNNLVQTQLGKSLDDILQEYRKSYQKTASKNSKNITKYKEQDPMSIKFKKLDDMVQKQKRITPIDNRNNRTKDTKTKKQQLTHLKSTGNAMKKSMINFVK